MKISTPEIIEREYKPFDMWAWFMSILGLCLMAKFCGIGWIFGTDKNWWMVIAIFFCFIDYVIRVSFGRIRRAVYYDTVIHRLYEIEISNGEIYYVCAENEKELAIYMETMYEGLTYKILKDTHTESFIKIEDTN